MTIGEPKKDYILRTNLSRRLSRYRNVTKNEIHFKTSREDHTYLVWDSVTHVKNVTIGEPK